MIVNKGEWCLDSECPSHMNGQKQLFTNIQHENGTTLKLASNQFTTPVKGKGIINLCVEDETYKLNDALCVPELLNNLKSIGRITDRGNTILFKKDKVVIQDCKGNHILTACKRNGL